MYPYIITTITPINKCVLLVLVVLHSDSSDTIFPVMVTKKELLDQLANYKKLGAPPLPFKDRRDLMIVWLIEEKVRKGHSVSRSAQLIQNSKDLEKLFKKYLSKDLSVSHIRNLYLDFKRSYDPDQVFEVHGSSTLTMLPTNEWKKLPN